jgi:hypothetical protein
LLSRLVIATLSAIYEVNMAALAETGNIAGHQCIW